MDERIERRRRRVKEVAISAVSLFVAGVVLFPPRPLPLYWAVLPLGEYQLLTLVALVSILAGAAISIAASVNFSSILTGGVIAYGSGMWAIETVYQPSDSPVHFLVYAGVLGCFVVGAGLAAVIGRTNLTAWLADRLDHAW